MQEDFNRDSRAATGAAAGAGRHNNMTTTRWNDIHSTKHGTLNMTINQVVRGVIIIDEYAFNLYY